MDVAPIEVKPKGKRGGWRPCHDHRKLWGIAALLERGELTLMDVRLRLSTGVFETLELYFIEGHCIDTVAAYQGLSSVQVKKRVDRLRQLFPSIHQFRYPELRGFGRTFEHPAVLVEQGITPYRANVTGVGMVTWRRV